MITDCDSEFVASLEWQILAFIAKRAARNTRKFARVSERELLKLTECSEQRFVDAAVGRLIAAGILEPARLEENGPIEGFICESAKRAKVSSKSTAQTEHDKMKLSTADLQFLANCGVGIAG